MVSDKDLEIIDLMIISREEVVYEGKIKSLTSINDKGKFDILGRHGNFISIVKDRLEFLDEQNTMHQIELKQGIIKVEMNKVKVFLGIGGEEKDKLQ